MLSTFLFAHRRNTTAERRVPVEGTPVRLRVPVTSLFFVICLCFASFTLTAEPLDQWHRRNPLPTADHLYAVTFGNNTFVAVGVGGAMASSMDGTNWVSLNSGSAEHLYGVSYGSGTFVAVGADGEILYSAGTNWTGAISGSASLLNAVTYGGGTFVAVGDVDFFGNATILTSSDGVSWNPADSGAPGLLTAVTYGNRSFVAVGETGLILTSSDAVNWTVADPGTAIDFNGVTYGNGLFVAVGGTNIFTSPDGLVWNRQSTDFNAELYSANFADGKFLAGGAGTILT